MSPAAFLVSDVACRHHERTNDCRYRVAWSINPHMQIGAVDFARAAAQHDAFVGLLVQLGADVTRLPFVHGAHDSVFAKDNAIVVDECALLARPRYTERVAEQAARARSLEALGITVLSTARAALEGGDVVMLPGLQGALLGYGFRSERAAASELSHFIDAPVTALRLVDPRLYHLDMAVAVLDDGTAIVCEDALSGSSRAELRKMCFDVISVSVDEALSFGVNLVQIGREVILGGRSRAVIAGLEERGYRVHVPELDQFHVAGGSAACLVARRHASTVVASTHAA
jgi:N-dimethylarginine dimethylaminohydrolase